jgi:methionyl aminopeptidase
MNRNNPCWCGLNQKIKQCCRPSNFAPGVKAHANAQLAMRNVILKDEHQIQGIRQACHLAAKILDLTCAKAKAGVSLNELNDYAHQLFSDAGALPAPLGYGNPPYPKSICISLNEVICHGIPDEYCLQAGDIANIDVSCQYQGFFGDCSRMVCIGTIDPIKQKVVDVSYDCLMKAIQVVKPGAYLSEIGDAIDRHARLNNCSVVDVFVGHGLGLFFHEGPDVAHHRNQDHLPLVAGMTFTIEPMINAGVKHAVVDPTDKWTARTKDGLPSAQWEHALLVTQTGVEILTPWSRDFLQI